MPGVRRVLWVIRKTPPGPGGRSSSSRCASPTPDAAGVDKIECSGNAESGIIEPRKDLAVLHDRNPASANRQAAGRSVFNIEALSEGTRYMRYVAHGLPATHAYLYLRFRKVI